MTDDMVASLLDALQRGEPDASGRLYSALYEEFRGRAHVLLRTGMQQTLCTTELVNETWLRLHGRNLRVETRAHFFNTAALAMRQVLIDRARARLAGKRGEGDSPFTLSAAKDAISEDPFDAIAVDQVMSALEKVNPKLSELAQLHLFAGLGFAEIASLTGSSERTTFRQWRTARMYLVKLIRECD